mgnify:CR=1 FL=1
MKLYVNELEKNVDKEISFRGFVDTISIPSQNMIWPRQAKVKGVNVDTISNVMTVWEEFTNGIREVVVSSFMIFGNENACMMLGIYCLVCIFIFVICTRKSVLAKVTI